MKTNEDISGGTQLGDYDDVDLFGLDAYMDGKAINPNWGILASAGVGSLTAVGVQQMTSNPKLQKASELIGFGAATLVAVPMVVFKKTRAAGWAGLFSALANHGPRILATYLSESEKAAVAARSAAVLARKAGAVPATTSGMRGVEIQEVPALVNAMNGAGLGLTMPEATQALGNAPHPELPQLVGTHLGQAQQQVTLLGGPTLASIAGHYGSTHFNKAN